MDKYSPLTTVQIIGLQIDGLTASQIEDVAADVRNGWSFAAATADILIGLESSYPFGLPHDPEQEQAPAVAPRTDYDTALPF